MVQSAETSKNDLTSTQISSKFFHQRLKLYREIYLFIFCVEKYLFAIKCHICLAFERVEWFTEAS